MSLPLLIVLAAVGWALFWYGLAALLQKLEIVTVELHEFTVLVIIVVFAGTGCVIGWPLGKVFRLAAGNTSRTREWAIVTTAAIVVLGEITEVLIHVFRVAGVFAPKAAIALIGPSIAAYTGLWWACKIITAAALGFSFYHSAARKTARMQV